MDVTISRRYNQPHRGRGDIGWMHLTAGTWAKQLASLSAQNLPVPMPGRMASSYEKIKERPVEFKKVKCT